MLARRTIFLILAVLLTFGVGIARLFVLRFSPGDIYPPYSSLRADPIGGKALYDSLSELDNIKVRRNEAPLHFLEEQRGATLVYTGVPVRYLSDDSDFQTLGKLAAAGNRVIIGFQPASDLPKNYNKEDEKKAKKDLSNPGRKKKPVTIKATKHPLLAPAKWELTIISLPKSETQNSQSLQMTGIDQPISYHSGLAFHPTSHAWKTLYSVAKTPVVIERSFGLGSLVLLADSYPLSNEALRIERRPGLLATLIGNASTVIFEETHFGVQENPGVGTLARRYRLHGVVGIFLLLALLFLWRNLTPLFPHHPDEEKNEIILGGQGAHSGLIGLLRRSVSPKQLPSVCLAEWIKSASPHFRPEAVNAASEIAPKIAEPTLERLAKINHLLNPHNRT